MKDKLIILAMRFAMLACNAYMGLFTAIALVNAVAGRPHITSEALVAVGVCVFVRVVIGVIGGLISEMWRFTLAWTIVGVSARPYADLLARTSESGQYLLVSLLVAVGFSLTIYGATDIGSAKDSPEVADI